MNNQPLISLMQYTYVRSDLVYRISLLNEFFGFIFFTNHNSAINKNAIEQFADSGKGSQKDINFLRVLPQSFMGMFEHNSFRDVLQDMSKELEKLPVLSLTVPTVFSSEHTDAIGKWVRNNISQDIILAISVDKAVSVGCLFVWKNTLHDFSLEHYLDLHEKELYTRLIHSDSVGIHA